MKIYLVIKHQHSADSIDHPEDDWDHNIAVFSTQEKAEAFIELMPDDYEYSYTIEAYELDNPMAKIEYIEVDN